MHVVYLLSHQNEDFKMSNKKELFKEFFLPESLLRRRKLILYYAGCHILMTSPRKP